MPDIVGQTAGQNWPSFLISNFFKCLEFHGQSRTVELVRIYNKSAINSRKSKPTETQ